MRVTRRRPRQPDHLATRAAVRAVLTELRAALPAAKNATEKELCSLLRAVAHTERSPRQAGRRGRRSRWSETTRELAGGLLRQILARIKPRLSARSFAEHYLLILNFPTDVAEALETHAVNLFEAEQLSRLTPKALQTTESKARQQRQKMLRVHLQAGESGARLKARIDARLYNLRPNAKRPAPANPFATEAATLLAEAAALEAEAFAETPTPDFADVSPDHVFYEYLQLIPALMHALDPLQIPEDTLDRVLHQSEQLIQQLNTLYKQQYPPQARTATGEAAKKFYI